MKPINANASVLVCRTSWMDSYSSASETAWSHHKYVAEGNTPHECLNFRLADDGNFHGFVQLKGDAEGNSGRVNIARLGAPANADSIGGCTVIWAATHRSGGVRAVGAYFDALVFKDVKSEQLPGSVFPLEAGQRLYRTSSDRAVLLPLDERTISLPRGAGGIGQNDLWYGLNEPQNAALKEKILETMISRAAEVEFDESSNGEASEGASMTEQYRLSKHKRFERRTQVRKFIYSKGFKCEACAFAIDHAEEPIWGSSFEVHHLQPFATITKDTERTVTEKDVAVLCANCHRAIHRCPELTSVDDFAASQYLR